LSRTNVNIAPHVNGNAKNVKKKKIIVYLAEVIELMHQFVFALLDFMMITRVNTVKKFEKS
jgi:hypothetical protein